MKPKSFSLFLISAAIIILTLLTATFWDYLKLGSNKVPLAIAFTVAFGISIAGLILGIGEVKRNKLIKVKIGIAGNSLVLVLFVYTIYYALNV
jgi:hypothetical protein